MIWTYNAMGTYVLVLTLATILVCVLLLLLRRSQGAGGLGLVSGLIGVLLGAAGAAAAVQLLDYDVVKVRQNMGASPAAGGAPDAGTQPAGSGAMGMSMGMGGMMGSGGMGGGMGGPNPKRDLTTLVRKVNLLTSDIALTLTPEQSAGLVKILDPLASKASLTDDEATALHEELLALFDEGQKAKQDAIGLPFRRGGGGPGGPGGGMGGPGGAAKPEPDANPFEQEQNAEALKSLLARFGGAPAAEMAPESTPETPEAKPAEAPEEKPAETAEEKPAEAPEAKPAEAAGEKPAETPET